MLDSASANPQEAILSTPFGFDLLPSNIELSKAEIALVNMVKREYVIERALITAV